METAIMWGWLLTASMPGMPVIIDPNYKTEADCMLVKADFAALYPDYDVACTPTWKPDAAPKDRKRVATRSKRYARR